MSLAPIITVEGLEKRFGDFAAVRQVSFAVEPGEIFGYLGANGAGKSTTIRMLCGLLRPTAGRAMVAGFDAATQSDDVKRSIGYMSQKFSLYLDLSVEHNLEFFGGIYGLFGKRLAARINEILEHIGMHEHRKALTGALPGGLRQRLALGSALLHAPRIVFLDEPTAGVDPASRRDFWRLIRFLAHQGTTVFVTTHYMDEAEYCGRIGMMVAGQLIALDTPAALKRQLVQGRMFQLSGQKLAAALPAVRALRGVLAAQSFGAGLRVRIDPALATEGDLERALVRAGGTLARLDEIQPSLWDVFIAAASSEVRVS